MLRSVGYFCRPLCTPHTNPGRCRHGEGPLERLTERGMADTPYPRSIAAYSGYGRPVSFPLHALFLILVSSPADHYGPAEILFVRLSLRCAQRSPSSGRL